MRRCDAFRTLALSSLTVACARQRAWAQGTLEKLRVAGPPTEDSTNIYYAVKTGLFARAGLEVEIVNTSNGSTATQAVIGGTYEIARTNLLSLLSAHLRGIPVALVAPSLIYSPRNPSILLQIAIDAPYKTGADLNGKIAGVPALNTGASLMTNAWVDRNGGNWRSLKFTEITNAAMEAAIVQHRVDVGVLQPPQLDASLAAGTTKTIGDCMGAIAANYMYGGYIARRDWAGRHAQEIRRFNRVMAEATSYVNAHLAETAPLVAEFTKIEVANVAKMHRSANATTLDPALVQPFIDAAAKYEEIPRAFPARDLL